MEKVNRSLLKKEAKASIKRVGKKVYLIMFVYLIITSTISMISTKLLYPKIDVEAYVTAYITNANAVVPPSTLGIMLYIALMFVTTILTFGFLIFTINISRNKDVEIGNLFDGFALFAKVIWLSVVVGFFAFLWALAIMIPAMLLMLALISVISSSIVILPVTVIYLAALILLIRILLRYSMCEYILIDNPYAGAIDCIGESKRMMKGRTGEYFVLALSFIGWYLLITLAVALVLLIVVPGSLSASNFALAISMSTNVVIIVSTIVSTIALTFLEPYVYVTFANFYNKICGFALKEPSMLEEAPNTPNPIENSRDNSPRDYHEPWEK